MKPVKDMTDQELNEWVAFNIMRWNPVHKHGEFILNEIVMPRIEMFDPCQDLNHTYLMEEKIIEMDYCNYHYQPHKMIYHSHLSKYKCERCIAELTDIEQEEGYDVRKLRDWHPLKDYVSHFDSDEIELLHATARQRCEAAYLTFQNKHVG